jgi:hypothetical protein
VPLKRQSVSTRLHGATSQKTVIFNSGTAERIFIKFDNREVLFVKLEIEIRVSTTFIGSLVTY